MTFRKYLLLGLLCGTANAVGLRTDILTVDAVQPKDRSDLLVPQEKE